MIEVKDVVEETRSGNIEAIGNLSKAQVAGVLANIRNEVSQEKDEIGDNGLGSYGLSMADLQLASVVKNGFSVSVDLETTLDDKSVFTGKDGVRNVDTLLNNLSLQKRLIQRVISLRMDELIRQGIISGEEDPVKLGGFAGVAAEYTVSEIKSYANGTASDSLVDGISTTQENAEFATNLVNTKASSILETISGIGGGAVSSVQSATDTIKTPSLNKALDEFIGSKRVPSPFTKADQQLLKAQEQLKKEAPANLLTGATPSGNITTKISKATGSIEKGELF